jgi:hypothetical protein
LQLDLVLGRTAAEHTGLQPEGQLHADRQLHQRLFVDFGECRRRLQGLRGQRRRRSAADLRQRRSGAVPCHGKSTFDLDAHGEVKVADQFKLYFDVLNVLDGKPTYDPNAGYGLYQFNAAWQDRLFMGRYLRVGAKVDF